MDCFLLQDWVTLKEASSGGTTPQSEGGWLDLAGYRDIVAWLDVREVSSSSIVIAYQSAPSKDESLFATMGVCPSPLVAGVTTTAMLQDVQSGANNAAPLARWLRWQVSLAGQAWDLTFRIWIAANKPGRASLNRNGLMRG